MRVHLLLIASLTFIQFNMATSTVFKDNLFQGKVAVVTGGGTGIGKAITTELASLGCTVVIASRKSEVLEKAASEMNELLANAKGTGASNTNKVYPFKCNIRKEDEV